MSDKKQELEQSRQKDNFLENITIQTPNKKINKYSHKNRLRPEEKQSGETPIQKVREPSQKQQLKQQQFEKTHNRESYNLKKSASTPKTNHFNNQKKVEPAPKISENQQVFYEQTYYVTAFKENYLILISQAMQVIEFPIGVLRGNISIGDPIKMKLQYDAKRAESDKKKFMALQEKLLEEYGGQD